MHTDCKTIAFVITRGDSIGGAQIHVRDFSRHLKLLGWSPIVYLGSSGALTSELDASGIRWRLVPGLVRSVNPVHDLRAILRLAAMLRQDSPCLVSCHTAKSGMVGRLAAFLAGIPSLFTAHGWQFAEGIGRLQKLLVLAIEFVCGRLSRKIITVSQYDYKLALHYHLFPEVRLRLVHNGMPAFALPQANAARSIPRIIMIARFQPQKDHTSLLQALSGLQDYAWQLDLVGDGPGMADSQEQALQLDIAERIRFLGQRLDVSELLAEADLFVLASHWEGFPRSILEAMRAGLPVVASDVGGVRESVEDGVSGYVVPRGDVLALRAALRALLGDETHRRHMGHCGRQSFDRNFTFEAMFRRTAKVWTEVQPLLEGTIEGKLP